MISHHGKVISHLGLLLRLLSSRGVFFPHSLTMVTIKPITAMAAKITVYQYFVMKRRNVARALSDRRSLRRVSRGPSGSTWKRTRLIEFLTTTSQLTSTTQGTSTSAYDTSKHFLSYDRCHNSRPHKRNVGHTRCLRHTHVLIMEKYTSTSSCKHCIIDQNIILKSKTRDLYLVSLYTICVWTQKDFPNLLNKYLCLVICQLSSHIFVVPDMPKSLSPFVPNIPSNLFTTPFSSTPSS